MTLRRLLLVFLGLLLVLHQDFWNWTELSWVGVLPTGFAYHLGFCVVVAMAAAALVRLDRPSDD